MRTGVLTDGQGSTVDFRNTLIVLTSNLGSEYLSEQLKEGESVELVRGKVLDAVKGAFRPEFLNRVDDILLFHRLERAHMGAIVDIQFGRLQKLLHDRDITLELTATAREWLGLEGYDAAYGARPLKRVIQREVQDQLAEEILDGTVMDGMHVVVDAGDEGLELRAVIEPQPFDAARVSRAESQLGGPVPTGPFLLERRLTSRRSGLRTYREHRGYEDGAELPA